ncbi:hypothetical protein HOY82DRAFT_564028, partial [Tuber indicum]
TQYTIFSFLLSYDKFSLARVRQALFFFFLFFSATPPIADLSPQPPKHMVWSQILPPNGEDRQSLIEGRLNIRSPNPHRERFAVVVVVGEELNSWAPVDCAGGPCRSLNTLTMAPAKCFM